MLALPARITRPQAGALGSARTTDEQVGYSASLTRPAPASPVGVPGRGRGTTRVLGYSYCPDAQRDETRR